MSSQSRDSISRASIINYLNAMVDEGLFSFTEVTGKGGHRRIYRARIDRREFWVMIRELALKKLEEPGRYMGNTLKSSS